MNYMSAPQPRSRKQGRILFSLRSPRGSFVPGFPDNAGVHAVLQSLPIKLFAPKIGV